MGHAAEASEQQQQHHEEEAAAPPRRRTTKPVDAAECLKALARDKRLRRYFSGTERDVLAALIRTCETETGRCESKIARIEALSGRNRRSVSRVVGGDGYRTTDGYSRKRDCPITLSERVQRGTLDGLVVHAWFSRSQAEDEWSPDERAARTGRAVNWLDFASPADLVTWGRERFKARRRAARERALFQHRRARASASTPTEEKRRFVVDDAHSGGVAEHQVTPVYPLPGESVASLSPAGEKSGSSPPPVPSAARARRAEDDLGCAASPASPGSCAPHAAAPPTSAPPTSTPRSNEQGSPPAATERRPLPADVARAVERIATTFVRELGRPAFDRQGEAHGSSLPRLLANRWREGATLDELDAAAYGGASDAWVRRSARSPAAVVFQDTATVQRWAHAGRELRDAAAAERLRREAAAAAFAAAPTPTADDLARELDDAVPVVRSAAAAEQHRRECAELATLRASLQRAWLESEDSPVMRAHIEREFARVFGEPLRKDRP